MKPSELHNVWCCSLKHDVSGERLRRSTCPDNKGHPRGGADSQRRSWIPQKIDPTWPEQVEPNTQSTAARDWDSGFVLNVFNKSRICFHERTTVILQVRVVSVTRRGRCLTADWGERIEFYHFYCWNQRCFSPLPAATCCPPLPGSPARLQLLQQLLMGPRTAFLASSLWSAPELFPWSFWWLVDELAPWRSDWVWMLVGVPPLKYCFQLISFWNHLRCRFQFM